MYLEKLLDIREESKTLREIMDALDEIKIIKSVLHNQIKVMESKTLNQLIVDTTAAVKPFAEVWESLNPVRYSIFNINMRAY